MTPLPTDTRLDTPLDVALAVRAEAPLERPADVDDIAAGAVVSTASHLDALNYTARLFCTLADHQLDGYTVVVEPFPNPTRGTTHRVVLTR